MNILDFKTRKSSGEKISMVTCYDFWSAQILNKTPVDTLLVGDSLAMVMHGLPNTLGATMEMMEAHVTAVCRGARDKFVVGDMPFLSFRKSRGETIENAGRLMRAGAQAVKIEGVDGHEEFILEVIRSGIPVMGHLGLTPQSLFALGGMKVQGRDEAHQDLLLKQAKRLEELGCFSVVLECVPAKLATQITRSLSIPTIGIGAGADCDGQVLVLQDLLGANPNFKPKFLRTYASLSGIIGEAVSGFDSDVKSKKFPNESESYT